MKVMFAPFIALGATIVILNLRQFAEYQGHGNG